jgi:hypothetical protein
MIMNAIINSIILTLVLWLVCDFFDLGMFGSILLLLFSFLVLQYRFKIYNYFFYFLTFKGKFSKVNKVDKVNKVKRNMYDGLDI